MSFAYLPEIQTLIRIRRISFHTSKMDKRLKQRKDKSLEARNGEDMKYKGTMKQKHKKMGELRSREVCFTKTENSMVSLKTKRQLNNNNNN
jgi:hypothetical protein